jgi:hypothetical protein
MAAYHRLGPSPRRWFLVPLLLIALTACSQSAQNLPSQSCGGGGAPSNAASFAAAVALSPTDLWAVGTYQRNGPEQALIEHWNGTQWNIKPTPTTTATRLYAVAAGDSQNVWAVGSGQSQGNAGYTFTEHWSGTSWALVPSPNAGTWDDELSAVTVLPSGTAWAVGRSQIGGQIQALTEYWDGQRWAVIPAVNPAAGMNQLQGVSGTKADDVWTVGFQRQSDATTPHPLIEHWNGHAWSVVSSPSPGYTASLYAVTAIAANDVWAAGGYDNGKAIFLQLFEHWDGQKWSVVSSSFVPNASLQTLSALGTSDIWAAGTYSRGANDNDTWLIEHWDGTRWTVNSPSPSLHGVMSSVVAFGPKDAAIIGTYSPANCGAPSFAVRRWNGQDWLPQPSPVEPF